MIKTVVDVDNNLIHRIECKPSCGEYFCDSCGDCLSCYNDDPCYENLDEKHVWIKYEKTD